MSQTAIEALQSVIGWSTGTGNEKFDRDDAYDRLKCVKKHAEIALSALHAKAGVSVEVKELEWVQLYEKQTMHPKEWHGTGIFDARYIIKQQWADGDFFVVGKSHKTLEAAKAAAQADYEGRILSAISTKLQEPVGDAFKRLAAQYEAVSKERDELKATLAHQPVTAGWETHTDDIAVDRFAEAMKAKLANKRAEGRGGWDNPAECSIAFLSQLLREHVAKGDPVDVGNLAMMIHQRGGSVE